VKHEIFLRFAMMTFGASVLCGAGNALLPAAETNVAFAAEAIDYYQPTTLTGTVYALADDPKTVLYRFKRTSTRSGSTVQVEREFAFPDGRIAARERVRYEDGALRSCELEELDSGATGSVTVQTNASGVPSNLVLDYSKAKGARQKTDTEKLQPDTLVNDMIAPWLAAHWDTLTKGSAVKFRLVSFARTETVGFKFIRQSETTLRGTPVVIVKMQPTSWIIARLVDPLLFTVEKAPPHRILQYVGRTTPRLRKGDGWKDLDAVTIYDWK
jgi:hypothetical protein